VGWRLTKKFAVGALSSLVGWGILAHDFVHQVWQLKGTFFSIEGGYVGLFLTLTGTLALLYDHLDSLKKTFKWKRK